MKQPRNKTLARAVCKQVKIAERPTQHKTMAFS